MMQSRPVSRPASCDRHRPTAVCTCAHYAHCDHACHHRDCDPTETVVLDRVPAGRGRADAVGLPRLHAGRGRAALPGLRADRVERPREDGRLGLMAEWLSFIHPPRDDFAATMTEEEIAVWGVHFERFQRALADGSLILVGPTLGPTNTGIAVFEPPDEATARRFMDEDPVIVGGFATGRAAPFRVSLIGGRDE